MFVDMTIQEASRHIINQLKTIYEDSEAENISGWVIEYITDIRRTDRIINKEKSISPGQELQLNQYMHRLLQHEPVQYVFNEAWFCGLKFYVDKNVLIPRPESEELVEWIISDCKFPIDKLSILDIGSGSGCLPIVLKKRLTKADVWSCDVSQEALKVANQNATALGVNVKFEELDFLNEEHRENLPSFDIIVSNPPYIPEKDKENMRPNVIDHEPATALFVPDNDALIFYKAIADFGKKHLIKNGIMYMEINECFWQRNFCNISIKGLQDGIKKRYAGKREDDKSFLLIDPGVFCFIHHSIDRRFPGND